MLTLLILSNSKTHVVRNANTKFIQANKKINAMPKQTADAVVQKFRSVENTRGLSPDNPGSIKSTRTRGLVAKEKFEEKLATLTDEDKKKLTERFEAAGLKEERAEALQKIRQNEKKQS